MRRRMDELQALADTAAPADAADCCSVEGCTAPACSSSNKHVLCRSHYDAYLVEYRKEKGRPIICAADDCEMPQKKRGYCYPHYRESTAKLQAGKCFTLECAAVAMVLDWCVDCHRKLHGTKEHCVAKNCSLKAVAAALCETHVYTEILEKWFWVGVDNAAPE